MVLAVTMQREPTEIERNVDLIAPESEYKRIISAAIGNVVERLKNIEETCKQFFQQILQQQNLEEFERQQSIEKALSKTPPDQFANEHAKQLEQLKQLEEKFNETYKEYLALQQQFNALNSLRPGLLVHAKYEQQREQQTRKDLHTALDTLAPGWNTPANKAKLDAQLKESVAAKSTVLETEALYMKSMEQHSGEKVNPKDRSTLQVALKYDMLQEIRLRASISQFLEENNPELTAAERKAKINDFFKNHLNEDEVIKRAKELESIYSHEDAATLANQLNEERGMAYLRTAKDELVNLDNKVQTQERIIQTLFAEYSGIQNNMSATSSKEMEVKKNLSNVLAVTSVLMSNPTKQEEIIQKWNANNPELAEKGFYQWALDTIKEYRETTGEEYKAPERDVDQDAISKVEDQIKLGLQNEIYKQIAVKKESVVEEQTTHVIESTRTLS